MGSSLLLTCNLRLSSALPLRHSICILGGSVEGGQCSEAELAQVLWE